MAEHWSWPVDVANLLIDTGYMSPEQAGRVTPRISCPRWDRGGPATDLNPSPRRELLEPREVPRSDVTP